LPSNGESASTTISKILKHGITVGPGWILMPAEAVCVMIKVRHVIIVIKM